MTRRVLVYEFVCGGGCGSGSEFERLLPEGLSMLTAIASDVAMLPDTAARTVVGDLPKGAIDSVRASGAIVVHALFDDHDAVLEAECKAADRVIIVAPEVVGVLDRLVGEQEMFHPSRLANCAPESIRVWGSKLQSFHSLRALGVDTPETICADEIAATKRTLTGPVVIKPDDGVGSGYRLVSDVSQLVESEVAAAEFVVQPFVDGDCCSVGVICLAYAKKPSYQTLPVCEQLFEKNADGQVTYAGGILDTRSPESVPFVSKIVDSDPGLGGYVGIDFLRSETSTVVVDVNPRLCTSYLGYRAATDQNLAAWILGDRSDEIEWTFGRWSWTKSGVVKRLA